VLLSPRRQSQAKSQSVHQALSASHAIKLKVRSLAALQFLGTSQLVLDEA
jgi:hypothetical protein